MTCRLLLFDDAHNRLLGTLQEISPLATRVLGTKKVVAKKQSLARNGWRMETATVSSLTVVGLGLLSLELM